MRFNCHSRTTGTLLKCTSFSRLRSQIFIQKRAETPQAKKEIPVKRFPIICAEDMGSGRSKFTVMIMARTKKKNELTIKNFFLFSINK